mgnify:CR=1 FL=1
MVIIRNNNTTTGSFKISTNSKVPDVKAYDDFLLNRPGNQVKNSVITGSRLRRIVILRGEGVTYKEIASMLGVHSTVARDWFYKLPPELRG